MTSSRQRRGSTGTGDPAAPPIGSAGSTPPDDGSSATPSLYLNRELATLEFNFRVLAMARDVSIPLLERIRYVSIVASNLDEFFEVRVATLRRLHALGTAIPGPDGLSSGALLARIRARVLELVAEEHDVWCNALRPLLAGSGVRVLTRTQWSAPVRAWLTDHFRDEVLPSLAPQELASAAPFPRIRNKTLNIAIQLNDGAAAAAPRTVLVGIPRALPRVIRIPPAIAGGGNQFVFLAEVLCALAPLLFPHGQVLGAYEFRVTRNGELLVDEAGVENLAVALKEELPGRGYARSVRLEVAADCPEALTHQLATAFELAADGIYRCAGPVNLVRVGLIYDWADRPDLKFPHFAPQLPPALEAKRNKFELIAQRDILLHHPYQSFAPVIDLLRQAAADPDVLAIKQTLYRAGADTPLLDHLVDAARRGKAVTIVIELRARFDEAANLRLAARLQESGVQVVYGVVGFKTHAKMLLIVRREHGALRRYAHVSTGNYHQMNSKVYTDIGLMTADPDLTEDVHKIFQQLSGLGPTIELKRLLHSPFTLYSGILERIEREAAHARAGQPARIVAKLNALNEAQVIAALYDASQAGVEVDLIVRGACTLRPGVPGVSERIRVRSIIGRFLEHSRVYWFANAGTPELYCASADWMERNLLRRIEIAFPLLDPALAARTFEETLANALADNTQAWLLRADGRYTRVEPGRNPPYSAQQALLTRFGA